MSEIIYVKNNKKYPVSFSVKKDGRDQVFEFDCYRVYSDTGNVATTGYTPIEKADYDWLLANVKVFDNLVKRGDLAFSETGGVVTMA